MTDQVRWRRTGLAGAMVLIMALLPGAAGIAIGANTRDIFAGSPPVDLAACSPTATNPGGFCPLTFTPVSATAGARTAVDVTIANRGQQTVNHLLLVGGAAADNASKNVNFPPPAAPSLPVGLRYVAVFPAGICTIGSILGPDDSLSCPIGSLASGGSLSIRIVIGVPAVVATYTTWLMASLNESSSNGTNEDEFYAVGSFSAASPNCSQNANYFLPDQAIGLATIGSCGQPTAIAAPAFPTQGAFASVGTASTTWCPSGFSCFGLLSRANVNNGAGGPVRWTVNWGSKPKLVVHFLDGYDPVLNATAYEVLQFKSASRCATPAPANALCWFSLTTSGGTTTAVFQTPSNGYIRGG
jgi:hypothetical protein